MGILGMKRDGEDKAGSREVKGAKRTVHDLLSNRKIDAQNCRKEYKSFHVKSTARFFARYGEHGTKRNFLRIVQHGSPALRGSLHSTGEYNGILFTFIKLVPISTELSRPGSGERVRLKSTGKACRAKNN
jgi:hypothetical protein